METNLQKATCGGCGNDKFEIYKDPNKEHLICECTQCKDTSEVVITQPKVSINWHGNSKGILCFPNK